MAWLAFDLLTRELRDGELAVGSGADADWRIATADLMPRHFVVTKQGDAVFVRPGASESVVVVNGVQLREAPHRLADGDLVLAGSGSFLFGEAAPRTAPVAPSVGLRAFLVDDGASLAHPLTSRSTPIGRDASNSIVVRDPLSRRGSTRSRRVRAAPDGLRRDPRERGRHLVAPNAPPGRHDRDRVHEAAVHRVALGGDARGRRPAYRGSR